jgi:AbiV family abortive infection protein
MDKALLSELLRGVEKTFENAEALFREASLLTQARCLSRALFLHQISLEECGKIEILGGWATSLLMGHTVDLGKVTRALASHASKNRANAYLLRRSEEEKAAQRSGDPAGAAKAFTEMQKNFHLRANTAKNASLYVDFEYGKFIAPAECITAEMVAEIAELNEEFLGLSFPKVKMLRNWNADPEQMIKVLANLEETVKDFGAKYPNDPSSMMELLLQELRTRMRKTPE